MTVADEAIIPKDIDEKLSKHLSCPIYFPVNHATISLAFQSFLRFTELSEAVKNEIDYRVCKTHRRGDIGYKKREPSDGLYRDSKEFFHYHPSIMELYPEFIESQPVLKEFLLQADSIYQHVEKTVKSILMHFESNHPGAHDKIFTTKNGERTHILLRFLKYQWTTSGKYLAKPHFDSGSMTLALAESEPGLRIGSCQEDLQLVEHTDNSALFFLSSNFEKVLGDASEFKPAWHDVIQLCDENIGRPYSRWAVVAFIEASDVEALSRDETHKFYRE